MTRFHCACPRPAYDDLDRRPNTCVKCAGYIDPAWVSSDANVQTFFDRLTSCQNLPENFPAFRAHCERRELAGRSTFGFRYLDRDSIEDTLEEACDLAIYPYLHGLRLVREGNADYLDLPLTAAYNASQAYDAMLQERERLK